MLMIEYMRSQAKNTGYTPCFDFVFRKFHGSLSCNVLYSYQKIMRVPPPKLNPSPVSLNSGKAHRNCHIRSLRVCFFASKHDTFIAHVGTERAGRSFGSLHHNLACIREAIVPFCYHLLPINFIPIHIAMHISTVFLMAVLVTLTLAEVTVKDLEDTKCTDPINREFNDGKPWHLHQDFTEAEPML